MKLRNVKEKTLFNSTVMEVKPNLSSGQLAHMTTRPPPMDDSPSGHTHNLMVLIIGIENAQAL